MKCTRNSADKKLEEVVIYQSSNQIKSNFDIKPKLLVNLLRLWFFYSNSTKIFKYALMNFLRL